MRSAGIRFSQQIAVATRPSRVVATRSVEPSPWPQTRRSLPVGMTLRHALTISPSSSIVNAAQYSVVPARSIKPTTRWRPCSAAIALQLGDLGPGDRDGVTAVGEELVAARLAPLADYRAKGGAARVAAQQRLGEDDELPRLGSCLRGELGHPLDRRIGGRKWRVPARLRQSGAAWPESYR